MALLTCRYFSDTLGLSTTATVILPEPATEAGAPAAPADGAPLPVLYLLHGLSQDDSSWTRFTSLERYVAHRRLAVVMPAVHRSYYANQDDGYRYRDFLVDELPRAMRAFFPLSTRREDTFIAGLSMGGYGAMKAALTRPERYAAAASLSGGLDVTAKPNLAPEEWRRTFGSPETAREAGEDVVALARAASPTDVPRLWAWCGTEDFLLEESRTFARACEESGLGLEYSESPGAHDWPAWDEQIPRVLDWLDEVRGND
ncbi:alpha/beta hydrolase family protein [Demequina sp. NBRC 110051]|uniref:alpha/beta hydrolase n=1 Tax=Demequina sp. NBRC 110051 TaxID=1570340 RepID=UPI0009FF3605|nr:alpha/beta hydrolase family protein [Demequina sp. NBRC 110051]